MIIRQTPQLLLITDQSGTFALCLPSFLPPSHACLCLCHPHLSNRPSVYCMGSKKWGCERDADTLCGRVARSSLSWWGGGSPGGRKRWFKTENEMDRAVTQYSHQLPSIHHLPLPDGCHHFISSPYIICVHMRVQRQVHEYVRKCAHE